VFKSQSLTSITRNYVRNVPFCEQCIVLLYANYLSFLWKAYKPKIRCHINI